MSRAATPAPEPRARVVRKRPKNRRAQIAAVAAAEFAAQGYHRVSIGDIAARLDITSAALYRHYPSKYALLAAELLRLGEMTVAAVTLPAEAAAWPPRRRLQYAIDGIIAGTLANRPTVALARWEARYLDAADKQTVDDHFATAITRLSVLIGEVYPQQSGRARRVRAVGVLGVVSGVGGHRLTTTTKSLTALLNSACWAMVQAPLPDPGQPSGPARAVERPATHKHEVLLDKAIRLFYRHGYPNVSVEDIASAAGLPSVSTVYRYYRGKGELLTAALLRAADRMSAVIGPTLAESSSPAEVLAKLVDMYVAGVFAERELTVVYHAEFGHLPPPERSTVRITQRLVLAQWATLLVWVRPALTAVEAHILVHAALGLAVDYSRVFGGDERVCPQQWVIRLTEAVLYGSHPETPE